MEGLLVLPLWISSVTEDFCQMEGGGIPFFSYTYLGGYIMRAFFFSVSFPSFFSLEGSMSMSMEGGR